MLLVDIILVLILLGLAGRGWRQGFVESLAELIGAIVAFLIAKTFSPWLGGIVGVVLPGRSGIAQFIAFIIIFLLVAKLIGWLLMLAAKALKIITSLPIISLVNKLLGGILGFLSGIVFVGSSVYLVLTFRLEPNLVTWLGSSTVARFTERIFSTMLRFLL